MFTKTVMFIFCRNIQKTVKSCPIRTFKYQFPRSIQYTLNSYSYSSLFSVKKLTCSHTISYSRHFPSANFSTCAKLRNSEPEEEKNPHVVKLVFIKPNGDEIVLPGIAGKSVMDAAIKQNGIMQASCDGQLACTTCHVYVDPKIKDLFPEISVEEDDLLDNAPFCKPNSRLSCQLILTEEMTEARFGLPTATTNMNVDTDSGKSKTKEQIKES